MSRFKASQEFIGKEIGIIVKYGNCVYNKVNKSHMYLTIGLVIGIAFEYYKIVLPIASILLISLFFLLEKTEQSAKKLERVIGNERKKIIVLANDDEVIYTNYLTDNKQEEKIKYQNIRHIVEVKDYIILVAEILTTPNYLLIPIKKASTNISENDLKRFLIEKCKNLECYKITQASHIYIILIMCLITYSIIITLSIIMLSI